MQAETKTVDINVENHGGMFLICPQTDAAREWIEENCEVADWQWLGDNFAMDDRRMAMNLIQGAMDDGLHCE